jgi:hypothetical protein
MHTWRKQSSGMWCRVDIVLTDISEEHIASIFSLEQKRRKIRERGTSVSRCHNPEDCFLHSDRRENLKSYMHTHSHLCDSYVHLPQERTHFMSRVTTQLPSCVIWLPTAVLQFIHIRYQLTHIWVTVQGVLDWWLHFIDNSYIKHNYK